MKYRVLLALLFLPFMLPAQAGTGYIWSVNGICPSFSPSDTFDCLIAKNYAPGALRGDEYRMEQAGGELCPNGERTQYCVLIRNLQRDERWHKWQQDSRDDYISRRTKECPTEYDEGGHSKRFFFGVKESETYYSKGTFYYCHDNCVYGANVYVDGANGAPSKFQLTAARRRLLSASKSAKDQLITNSLSLTHSDVKEFGKYSARFYAVQPYK